MVCLLLNLKVRNTSGEKKRVFQRFADAARYHVPGAPDWAPTCRRLHRLFNCGNPGRAKFEFNVLSQLNRPPEGSDGRVDASNYSPRPPAVFLLNKPIFSTA